MFRVQVYAYVCMENHYHLLIRTPDANASRAIQWLNVSYSVWFNRRRGYTGHVFQGRFKGIVVEGGEWGLELSVYMHLNPVATKKMGAGKAEKKAAREGLSSEPTKEQVERRLEELRRFEWSSYQAYAGYGRSRRGWRPAHCWSGQPKSLGSERKRIESLWRSGFGRELRKVRGRS